MPKKVVGRFKEKYNEGCIRVFKFLMLLLNDEAYYDDVIELFKSEERSEKQHVTLNKYINTLKIFGLTVQKIEGKYIIKNIPFASEYTVDDLIALNIFDEFSKQIPDKKTYEAINKLIKTVKKTFNEQSATLYSKIQNENQTDYSFYYGDLKYQIQKCEEYIKRSSKINIKYTKKNTDKDTDCIFKEIIYDNKQAYIKIFKTREKEFEEIPIANIKSIEETPSLNNTPEIAITTVFRLKGRLATAYTLKEGEYISEYCEDGSIVVVNKGEPTEKLLSRLMRYDCNCIIERPKEMRNRIKEMISEALKKYE